MAKRGPRQQPRDVRFWARVNKTDGCWLWTAAIALRGGYGHFYDDDGRQRRAHRVSWELTYEAVPEGLYVCHRCDTPLCVRPDHLFLGDQAVNLADMRAKGRTGYTTSMGEARYNAKLTEDAVRVIRAAAPSETSALARRFGVSRAAINSVQRRASWAHVV